MNMHSWVFRNRARLRLIYGDPTAPSRDTEPQMDAFAATPCQDIPCELLPRGVEERMGVSASVGSVQKRAWGVVMTPMPRRVG